MKKITILLALTMSIVLSAKEATVEQLFSVQTVKVKKQTLSQRVKNYGFVKADEARIYDMTPRFYGYVVKLYADKIYMKVKKGQLLAEVYSPEVFKAKDEYLNTYKYTQLRQNKGMLESAKLKLELLGVSQKEIADVIKQDKAMPNTKIYASQSGYIFEKNINNGSAFKAKQKIFQIVNLDEIWVEAKLFEEERAQLSITPRYELRFKGLDTVYKTTKRLLYPELNPKVATLTLRLRIKNTANQLFPGMYATVISLENSQTQLTLPSTAVILKNGKHYVFMVGDYEGEYEPLEVQVEVINANTYAITDGLSEGEEVVNNALFMMDSDAQINGLY